MSETALTKIYKELMWDLFSKMISGRPSSESDMTSQRQVHLRIKSYVESISKNPHFGRMAVPGQTYLQFLLYWNKLEGLNSAWEEDDSETDYVTYMAGFKEIQEIFYAIRKAELVENSQCD